MVAVTPSHTKAIYKFIGRGTTELVTRLNVSRHYQKKSSKTVIHVKKQDGSYVYRSDRGHCIVCCGTCDKHSNNYHAHCTYRHGRKTTGYCVVCRVYACSLCWVLFHTEIVLVLSLCLQKKLGLATPRVLRYVSPLSVATRPQRSALQTSTRVVTSPAKAGSTA
jgi:hypothetical protein